MKLQIKKIELLKKKIASSPNDTKMKRELNHLLMKKKQHDINKEFPL
ncbi:hypothetical protein [Tenacibaculum maritimum]|nr:hypothetical protein [Tenacibaculum maritimum]